MSTDDDDGLTAELKAAEQHEADRLADPYSYSELVDYAELDTWRVEQALMLMAGIAPTGADIKSSHENFLGVRVDEPKIVNAQLLTEPNDFYRGPWSSPATEYDAMTPSEHSEMLTKREKLKQAEQRYRKIVRLWHSDPDHASRSMWPAQDFLEWANRRNIDVPWRTWYEANRTTPSRNVDHVTAEPKTDLIAVRAETTFLNIIGGLLGLMLGSTPAGKRQSVFESQAAVIDALLATYPAKPGISKRTLEQKFAHAKRAIDDT